MIYDVFKKLFFKFFIAKLSIYYYQDSIEYMFLKIILLILKLKMTIYFKIFANDSKAPSYVD